MIILSIAVRCNFSFSAIGRKVSTIDKNELQAKKMFALSGETSTTTGSCIPKVQQISRLKVFVAVAVRAIIPTLVGTIDLNSPSF